MLDWLGPQMLAGILYAGAGIGLAAVHLARKAFGIDGGCILEHRRQGRLRLIATGYEQKIRVVVDACIRANPDITDHSADEPAMEIAKRLRLADVALAMLLIRSRKKSACAFEDLRFWWNLDHDSLLRQSNECVGFAYDNLRFGN